MGLSPLHGTVLGGRAALADSGTCWLIRSQVSASTDLGLSPGLTYGSTLDASKCDGDHAADTGQHEPAKVVTVSSYRRRRSRDAVGRDDDAGLSLIELLVASAIGTMVISIVSIWLFTSQSTSNDFLDANSDESDVQLILDAVVATITDARPTALCLEPHPNTEHNKRKRPS